MKSQNGWTVLSETSIYLHQWVVPTESGDVLIRLRRGSPGFVLCHWLLWFAERIEPVAGKGDDFGWAYRRIANSVEWSNHASGTAEDLNASAHLSGVSGSFSQDDAALIRARLAEVYPVLRWGGGFRTTVDEMHFEIAADQATTRQAALTLLDTPRGLRLLEANPTQGRILS
jgi:hypothetical protein